MCKASRNPHSVPPVAPNRGSFTTVPLESPSSVKGKAQNLDDAEKGHSPADGLVNQSQITTMIAIGTWFALNIAINNVNKWVFYVADFKYPVTLTLCHMIFCHLLAASTMKYCPPKGLVKFERIKPTTIRSVRFLAIAFCGSVVCGNVALRFLFVSFTQMIGSTTPLVSVMLDTVRGKRHSKLVYVSMALLSGGVMLCTKGETNFHMIGFLACVVSVLLRATKSILSEVLLSGEDKLDAVTLLYFMSQSSIPMLACGALILEPHILSDPVAQTFTTWSIVILSATIAFGLNVTNFLVTQFTSAVTLQVLGNAKNVLTIVLSVWLFGNSVSLTSAIGCCITLFGVGLYNWAKSRK